MKIYCYDVHGYYAHLEEAFLDPIDGQPIIPANATLSAPPAYEKKINFPKWNGTAWELVPCPYAAAKAKLAAEEKAAADAQAVVEAALLSDREAIEKQKAQFELDAKKASDAIEALKELTKTQLEKDEADSKKLGVAYDKKTGKIYKGATLLSLRDCSDVVEVLEFPKHHPWGDCTKKVKDGKLIDLPEFEYTKEWVQKWVDAEWSKALHSDELLWTLIQEMPQMDKHVQRLLALRKEQEEMLGKIKDV